MKNEEPYYIVKLLNYQNQITLQLILTHKVASPQSLGMCGGGIFNKVKFKVLDNAEFIAFTKAGIM